MRIPRRLLPDEVSIVGVGALRCRVTYERVLQKDSTSSELIGKGTLWARPGPVVPLDARVTLPDGTERFVAAVAVHTGRSEPEVLEVTLR